MRKYVRQNLLKLRGSKMSEIYEMPFQKEDFEWLQKNKDRTAF